MKGLPVILLLVVAGALYKKNKIAWRPLLINSSLYLTYVITLLYTDNFKYSVDKLETGLSILILPVIFFVFLPEFKIRPSLRTNFFKLFIISTAIFSITVIVWVLIDDTTVYYKDWYSNKFRTIIKNIYLIGQHPIYASIFISLSVILFLELLKEKELKSFFKLSLFSLLTLVNISLLLMLLSKGIVIALMIVIAFFIAKDPKVKSYKKLIFTSFFAGIIALFIFNRRMSELLMKETFLEVNPNFSTSIRVGVYKCTLKLIKEEWVFGYGVGDSQDALNGCYALENKLLLKGEYNTHSQYLDIVLKTGIFGLIIFLLFLSSNILKARKNNNHLAISIILFYVIAFLTENILARQSGVILFYFLVLFLNNKTINSNEIVSVNKEDYLTNDNLA
ncbi:MAG: O-antigen ligase family protein [Flavobacteriaceae bacterium]